MPSQVDLYSKPTQSGSVSIPVLIYAKIQKDASNAIRFVCSFPSSKEMHIKQMEKNVEFKTRFLSLQILHLYVTLPGVKTKVRAARPALVVLAQVPHRRKDNKMKMKAKKFFSETKFAFSSNWKRPKRKNKISFVFFSRANTTWQFESWHLLQLLLKKKSPFPLPPRRSWTAKSAFRPSFGLSKSVGINVVAAPVVINSDSLGRSRISSSRRRNSQMARGMPRPKTSGESLLTILISRLLSESLSDWNFPIQQKSLNMTQFITAILLKCLISAL